MNKKRSKMNYKAYETNLKMKKFKMNLDKEFKLRMTKQRRKNE